MSVNYVAIVAVVSVISAAGVFLLLSWKSFVTRSKISALLSADETSSSDFSSVLAGIVKANAWLENLVVSDQRPLMEVKIRRLGFRAKHLLRYLGLIKLVFGAVFAFIGIVIWVLGSNFGILVSLGGLVLGIYVPDILIDRRIESLEKQIARDIPDFTDLLNICIRSGMTLSLAVDRVARGMDRAIRVDLMTISERSRMGDSVEEAIESLTENKEISVPTANALGSIARATQLGIPLGDVIQQSADDLRKQRVDETKAEAAKLPVKILIPLMVCLLPCVMIVVLGPAVLGMVEGFAALGG